MRSSSISRKPGAFGAIGVTVDGLDLAASSLATRFFTGETDLVNGLASVFGFELPVPEMRPPSPRPSLVLELDMFEEISIEKWE